MTIKLPIEFLKSIGLRLRRVHRLCPYLLLCVLEEEVGIADLIDLTYLVIKKNVSYTGEVIALFPYFNVAEGCITVLCGFYWDSELGNRYELIKLADGGYLRDSDCILRINWYKSCVGSGIEVRSLTRLDCLLDIIKKPIIHVESRKNEVVFYTRDEEWILPLGDIWYGEDKTFHVGKRTENKIEVIKVQVFEEEMTWQILSVKDLTNGFSISGRDLSVFACFDLMRRQPPDIEIDGSKTTLRWRL